MALPEGLVTEETQLSVTRKFLIRRFLPKVLRFMTVNGGFCEAETEKCSRRTFNILNFNGELCPSLGQVYVSGLGAFPTTSLVEHLHPGVEGILKYVFFKYINS